MTSWSDDDETAATGSRYGTDQRCRRALARRVSGLKEAKLWLSGDGKKVDRPLCLEGTRTSVDYEPLRRGRLNPRGKPTQVSGGRAP